MAIAVTCAHCGATFGVKAEFAGRRGKCPKCQQVIEVPPAEAQASGVAARTATAAAARSAPTVTAAKPSAAATATRTAAPPAKQPAAPPARSRDRAEEILAGFQGTIEPVQVSPLYKLGIGLVSLAMVVLPLLYVMLIGLVCVLLYYHAVGNTSLMAGADRSSRKVGAFLYLAPLAAGGILLLFMVKPLFAKRVVREKPRSLTRQGEPLLFAFVDRVCAAVGAPAPTRIDVDCQVNASASFRRGLLSMMGNDLVLTIGLPLVAGLNLRQFAGVLAHEFGHFSQGAGMRLSYVIRSISFWFTRVVYERDEWDERLRDWSRRWDFRIGIVFYLAMFCIWLTRKVLWLFMMLGHMVSGFLMRQMEFDADRYEARLAGSACFASTARRLQVIGVASQGAYADLGEFYREGRLGDNLPRLIEANIEQIPPELQAELEKYLETTETGLFDTHPADKDRIASANAENAVGVFQIECPATELFSDFGALAKTATWDLYRSHFGEAIKLTDMHPVAELLERQQHVFASGKAMLRYFQQTFITLRPLTLPAAWIDPPDNARAKLQLIKQAREQLIAGAVDHVAVMEKYDQVDSQIMDVACAGALIKAKLRIKPDTFTLRMTNADEIRAAQEAVLAEQKKLAAQLAPIEQANGQRLFAALQLLHHPQVQSKIKDAPELLLEANNLLAVGGLLSRQLGPMLRLRNTYTALGTLLSNLQGNEEKQSLLDQITTVMTAAWEQVRDVRESLASHQYPFDHAKGEIMISDYVLAEMPRSGDLGAIYDAAAELLNKAPGLYGRVVAQLASIAELVETALGLPPLPEPEKKPAPIAETSVAETPAA